MAAIHDDQVLHSDCLPFFRDLGQSYDGSLGFVSNFFFPLQPSFSLWREPNFA